MIDCICYLFMVNYGCNRNELYLIFDHYTRKACFHVALNSASHITDISIPL